MKYNAKEEYKHPLIKKLEEANLLEIKVPSETLTVEEWCNEYCKDIKDKEDVVVEKTSNRLRPAPAIIRNLFVGTLGAAESYDGYTGKYTTIYNLPDKPIYDELKDVTVIGVFKFNLFDGTLTEHYIEFRGTSSIFKEKLNSFSEVRESDKFKALDKNMQRAYDWCWVYHSYLVNLITSFLNGGWILKDKRIQRLDKISGKDCFLKKVKYKISKDAVKKLTAEYIDNKYGKESIL